MILGEPPYSDEKSRDPNMERINEPTGKKQVAASGLRADKRSGPFSFNLRLRGILSLHLISGSISLCTLIGQAFALEGQSPYPPGISVGADAGALPPPGLYGALDTFYVTGTAADNSGRKIPINGIRVATAPSVLWVPELELLNARLGVLAAQPVIWQRADATQVGNGTMVAHGFFNPFISPINLQYKLPYDLYTRLGLGFYLPIGNYIQQGNRQSPISVANNTWTIEPDLGLSWLSNGWNLSVHSLIDFQTTNNATNYSSGNVFYLDLTTTKTIGRWTFGVGGNYTQQFTDDFKNGMLVNGNGNLMQHVLLGPVAYYNFGPFSVKALGLFGLRATNDINASFFHIVFAGPF